MKLINFSNISKGVLAISLLSLTACNLDKFEDQEIKGTLVTDRSARGNTYLEVADKDSDMTRFIHPGKKIISVEKDFGKVIVRIMDSRRVLLATVQLKIKDIKKENYSETRLFIAGSQINQNWDLEISRTKIPLQTEYLQTRDSSTCDNGKGLKGDVWRVFDYRSDYIVNFYVPGSDKIWGHLEAKGERHTDTTEASIKCSQLRTVHQVDMAEFE